MRRALGQVGRGTHLRGYSTYYWLGAKRRGEMMLPCPELHEWALPHGLCCLSKNTLHTSLHCGTNHLIDGSSVPWPLLYREVAMASTERTVPSKCAPLEATLEQRVEA